MAEFASNPLSILGRFSLSATLALLAGACGGEDEGRPSRVVEEPQRLDYCESAAAFEYDNLISFDPRETSSGQPNYGVVCAPTHPCSFYFNYDVTHSLLAPGAPEPPNYDCVQPVSTELPVSNPGLMQMSYQGQPLPSDRCGSEGRGMHITAQNIGMCVGSNGRIGWGGAWDITFAPPLDAEEWDGISFWMRRGDPTTKSALILSVVDPYTNGEEPDPETNETCIATDPLPGVVVLDSDKCDAFGTAISLSDDWVFYPARFADMHQKGFGMASPLGRVDSSRIVRLQFLITAGNWDFWIDDIQLFRDPD